MSMEMNVDEKENYKSLLEIGLQFQDYITDKLRREKGIILTHYTSKKYQYNVGENPQGLEIKYDAPASKTGNLLVEIGERTSSSGNWVKSGIYRGDNSIFYLIGNYDDAYLFDIRTLRNIHKKKEYLRVQRTETGIFFLLEKERVEKENLALMKI